MTVPQPRARGILGPVSRGPRGESACHQKQPCAQQLQYAQSSLPFSPLRLHARRSFFRRKRMANIARKTSAAASSTCLWDVHKPQADQDWGEVAKTLWQGKTWMRVATTKPAQTSQTHWQATAGNTRRAGHQHQRSGVNHTRTTVMTAQDHRSTTKSSTPGW